jgi:hypothetical protein
MTIQYPWPPPQPLADTFRATYRSDVVRLPLRLINEMAAVPASEPSKLTQVQLCYTSGAPFDRTAKPKSAPPEIAWCCVNFHYLFDPNVILACSPPAVAEFDTTRSTAQVDRCDNHVVYQPRHHGGLI